MAAANEHHQQNHQDQQFGYVKFDLLLDGEEAPITPWVILPDEWIPAFNGRLHTYYPQITSEVCMNPTHPSSSAVSLTLPDQFFSAPKIITFTDTYNLCAPLTDLSNSITTFEQIVPVVVIAQEQETKFKAWVKKNHPDLLHPRKKPAKLAQQTQQQKKRSTANLLWKILGVTRKTARVSTKIALGTISGTAGGAAGLVVGTLGASAGGVIYSFNGQMSGGYFGGTKSKTPLLDFVVGTLASPFVGAGMGGYIAIYGTNTVVDKVDQALYGESTSSNDKH